MNRHLLTACVAFLALLVLSSPHTATAESPEYLSSFDPVKGFKPAQANLTEIYLQLAGSLEVYGSPEPYLRHVLSENARIEEIYRRKSRVGVPSFRPAYLTEDYVDKLSKNWALVSPRIGLEPYTKDFGHMMRLAIKGTRDTGTILVDIFNKHQDASFQELTGESTKHAGFEELRLELVRQLELDKTRVDEERYEVARRDAISFALGIHGQTIKLFRKLEPDMSVETLDRVRKFVMSVIMDCGTMAQSELDAAIAELAISGSSTTAR